jgi:site-specific DNA-methyltransferase (adenine-specific)
LRQLELGDLRAVGFDLTLTGFDQDELDRLLVVEPELDADPDDAPEPPADSISKPGDLWILRRSSRTVRGRHGLG